MKMVKLFDRYTDINPYMEKRGFKDWFDPDYNVLSIPGNDCAVYYWVKSEEELADYDYDWVENNIDPERVKLIYETFNQFFLDNGCKIEEGVWIDITW